VQIWWLKQLCADLVAEITCWFSFGGRNYFLCWPLFWWRFLLAEMPVPHVRQITGYNWCFGGLKYLPSCYIVAKITYIVA